MGSPSVVRRHNPMRGGSFAVESAAAFAWNRWQACYGINGSFRVERVAALPWNPWQDSPGIGGSFAVEYAPQEQFFLFDPSWHISHPEEMNAGELHWHYFADWEFYRANVDMIRKGIFLLNKYYYDWLSGKYSWKKPLSEEQFGMILQIIECLGGIYGLRPAMEPYIAEPMRHALFRALQGYVARKGAYQAEKEHKRTIQSYYDERTDDLVVWREITWKARINAPDFPRILMPYDDPACLLTRKSYQWHPGHPLSEQEFHRRLRLCRQLIWNQPPDGFSPYISPSRDDLVYPDLRMEDIPSTFPDMALYQGIQQLATYIGMPSHELEHLISWRVKPLDSTEEDTFYTLIKVLMDDGSQTMTNEGKRNAQQKLPDLWVKHQAIEASIALKREGRTEFPRTHLEKVSHRALWQIAELQYFLLWCFKGAVYGLEDAPVKLPSGKYNETLRVERTQQDIINEMAIELASLPRFTAYAKIIDEQSGRQKVLKSKIQTLPLPKVLRGAEIETSLIEKSHVLCTERGRIDEEIRQRQEKWRETESQRKSEPPEEPPPPTRMS
jgi:hypothetical protein